MRPGNIIGSKRDWGWNGLATRLAQIARLPWLDDAALGLIWIVACLPVLRGARFIGGDSLGVFYAQAHFIVTSLLRGQSPWWNPFEYGGLPVLADPQSLAFTPHILVGLIAGQAFDLHLFDLITVACPLFGALALRRYATPYSYTRLLPLLGAAVFMLGGVATSRLQHVPQIVSYSLLPVQLLAFRAVCLRPAAWTAALLAVSLLAGLLNLNQVTFLSAFALLPFVLFHLARSSRRIPAALYLAAAGLAALVAAAPLLLAVAEYLPLSNRAVLPLGASAGFSFPLLNLTSLFLPGLFGVMTPQLGFWPPTDASQDYLYIGWIPCVVLLLALWRMPRAPWPAPLFALMAGFWFVFALGTHTPVYRLLFEHVPGFDAFRRPADGAFLMNFSIALAIGSFRADWLGGPAGKPGIAQTGICLAVVAAMIFASIDLHAYALRTGHARELGPILRHVRQHGLVIAVAMAGVLGWRSRQVRTLLPAVVMIGAVYEMLEAGRFGPVLTNAYGDNSVAQIFGKPAGQVAGQGGFTAEIEQTLAFLRANGAAGATAPIRIEVLGGALGNTVPWVEGMAVTQGYNPLQPGAYARIIGAEDLSRMARIFSATAPFYDSPRFRRLGVRYVLMDKYTSGPVAQAIATIRTRLAGTGAGRSLGIIGAYEIWELRDVLPKAMLQPAGGACRLRTYTNTKLVVSCRSATAATLVIGDNYAPGWTACVNGRPAPVSIEDELFRGVRLEAGDSWITLRYQAVPYFRDRRCPDPPAQFKARR